MGVDDDHTGGAPTSDQLDEIRASVERAMRRGPHALRKKLLAELIHEIRVRSRDHIQPFFRVPAPAQVRIVDGWVGLGGLEPPSLGL